MKNTAVSSDVSVHGGIRHLESVDIAFDDFESVHGGIRHLEISQTS